MITSRRFAGGLGINGMDYYDLAITVLEATREHAVLVMVLNFLRRL